MLIDSHCHLDFPQLSNSLESQLLKMQEAGVGYALCVSVTKSSYVSIKSITDKYSNIFASVGVHPDYLDIDEPDANWLISHAMSDPKIIAIGETGLDYFRFPNAPYASLAWQRDRFSNHIEAALIAQKPLIIHTRQAADDTIAILKSNNADKVGGVFHCFTESKEVALAALDMGFYISFSGIVTFKNSTALQDTCKYIPLDRILVETDSPYLAPQPVRGTTNHPANVAFTAAFIASLKNIEYNSFCNQTTDNFNRLFKTNCA